MGVCAHVGRTQDVIPCPRATQSRSPPAEPSSAPPSLPYISPLTAPLHALFFRTTPAMRPWSCIPIGLLAFLPLVAPAQLPLQQPAPTTQSFTLLDALYKDPDYESLIKLLQRAKLIPTFNRLNGSTFFAPTNDAIKHHASLNFLWQEALNDDASELQDNLQIQLRQQLFYHLLNETLTDLPTEQTPQEYRTLLYPRETSEPPSQEPPPYPPWMPVQNGTLGTNPQRLRLAARDETLWAGVDAAGKDGVKVVKDTVEASNGLLLGLDRVMEMPPDLGEYYVLRDGHPNIWSIKRTEVQSKGHTLVANLLILQGIIPTCS